MPTVTSPRGLRRVRSHAFAIEEALLRASVGALTADRDVCKHCHRTPLTGERIYFFGDSVVCELCRPRRLGAPDASEVVAPVRTGAVRPVPPVT